MKTARSLLSRPFWIRGRWFLVAILVLAYASYRPPPDEKPIVPFDRDRWIIQELLAFHKRYKEVYDALTDRRDAVIEFPLIRARVQARLAHRGIGDGRRWPANELRQLLGPKGWVVECGMLSVGANRVPLVWIGRLRNRVSSTVVRFDGTTMTDVIYDVSDVVATPPLTGIRAWTGGQVIYLFDGWQPSDVEHECQHVADRELVELLTADHLSELGFRRLQAFVEARAALRSIIYGPRPAATLAEIRLYWPWSADYRSALPLLEAALNFSLADHLSDTALRQRAAVGLAVLDRDYPDIVAASHSLDPLSTALTHGR